MPVFVVDARPYRVPSKALFKGNKDICEQIIADKHERGILKPNVSLEQATATRTQRRKDTTAADETNQAWSTREDRILRELIALRLPWSRMSVALGNRPVDEIRSRWDHIRRGKLDQIEREVMVDGAVSTGIGGRRHYPMRATTQDSKPERHVSFADPLVTGGDTDDDNEEDFSSDPPKVKNVYYIDKEFSLEDVVMLHNIAAKWERDRWLAISTRFNDITQRSITPEQAKSVIDG